MINYFRLNIFTVQPATNPTVAKMCGLIAIFMTAIPNTIKHTNVSASVVIILKKLNCWPPIIIVLC